ncbi:hypothetical protein [Thauera humireducens]|uniref:hypothetical protein n=1 Tax=Thauera humireducens TaxID=1134435 RepID=UPI0024A88D55|nr:hypothetical protein [Thauera humireducens]
MIPEIDFSLLGNAAVGAIAGAAITVIVLSVLHRRRLKAERSQEHIARPICLYSTTDPLGASIVRASRGKQ